MSLYTLHADCVNSAKSKIRILSKKYPHLTFINVLSWQRDNPNRHFSPYYLKTDGNEKNYNPGGIIFENFYQGSKVPEYTYSISAYAHKTHKTPIWTYFIPDDKEKIVMDNDVINYAGYDKWQKSLWACRYAVRYPVGYHKRHDIKFSLVRDKYGNETRYDYLNARLNIYVAEYNRLVTPFIKPLIDKLKMGKSLVICEVDVPKNDKKGEFGIGCDSDEMCLIDLDKINKLLIDLSEPFGHGLSLIKLLYESV